MSHQRKIALARNCQNTIYGFFIVVVVNGTRDVVGLGNVGFGLKATVVVVNGKDLVGLGNVGFGLLVTVVVVNGGFDVIVFGAVVAGKVVKLRAAFFWRGTVVPVWLSSSLFALPQFAKAMTLEITKTEWASGFTVRFIVRHCITNAYILSRDDPRTCSSPPSPARIGMRCSAAGSRAFVMFS
ncbi:MAG: hypothetical protein RLZ02_1103 [Actinomycetota bacterium]